MATSDQNNLMLGELRGQVSGIARTLDNLDSKFDTMFREVAAIGPLVADVAEVKAAQSVHGTRIAALEADKERREGATGIIGFIWNSPALAWIGGAAATIYALFSSQAHH
ncbi:hypothetical protein BH10PSE14_BH10PSE14_04230 [soil metagenome]